MQPRALRLDELAPLAELDWVRTLARSLLADPNDADDVVQEAWLRARILPGGFASPGSLRAWLAAATRRMARDTRRARLRRWERERRAARPEASGAEDVAERGALAEAVLRAVNELEEPCRSTVLLRYMDGRSTSEVAAALSVSEEVARKRLSRALARLRARLEREWGRALHPSRWRSPERGPGRRARPRHEAVAAAVLVASVYIGARIGARAGAAGRSPRDE